MELLLSVSHLATGSLAACANMTVV